MSWTPICDIGEPTGPMLKGRTYIVRPRMQPLRAGGRLPERKELGPRVVDADDGLGCGHVSCPLVKKKTSSAHQAQPALRLVKCKAHAGMRDRTGRPCRPLPRLCAPFLKARFAISAETR